MALAPTLEQDRKTYGVRIDRQEFPVGVAGVRLSLSEIARRIREGGRTPSIRAFAENVVRQTIPPSQATSSRQIAAALLAYVIENVRYRADPPLTEWVQGAAITLCVNGAPMCIPVADCDDLCVALGSMFMALGIPVRVVKQTFGVNDQEHVLIEFQDEGGEWIAVDATPRSPSLQVGQRAVASHEDYIDPLDPSQIGMVAGTPEAEFIGVGGVPVLFERMEVRDMGYVNGVLEERAHGKTWQRIGDTWIEKQVGLGDVAPTAPSAATGGGASAAVIGAATTTGSYAQAQTDLQNMVLAVIAAGDAYMDATPPEYAAAISAYKAAGQTGAETIGPEIDAVGHVNFTGPFTHQAWLINASLAAISGTTQADALNAQSYAKQMGALYRQAINIGSSPPKRGGFLGMAPLVAILTIGTVGGIAYAVVEDRKRGRR